MDVENPASLSTRSKSWICDLAIPGPEDVVVDPASGCGYVSSQDRGATEWVIPSVLRTRSIDWTQRGYVYRVDLQSAPPAARRMRDDMVSGEAFHPCGLDHFGKGPGRDRLFVINWQTQTDFAIEVFEINDHELRWVHHATSDKLTLPNDVCALNDHQFYVTNSASRTPWLRKLEMLLPIPAGNVLFHDLETGEWTEVASGIHYANGIAIDRDRKRLFVASSLSHKILAFPWDPEAPDSRLFGRQEIEIDFLPDNLAWEPGGTDALWVAGSERLQGAAYMFMRRDRAPSHVARVNLPSRDAAKPETDPLPVNDLRFEPVYDDDGGEIAACSVAAPYWTKGGELRFIVGACFGDHAVICRAVS